MYLKLILYQPQDRQSQSRLFGVGVRCEGALKYEFVYFEWMAFIGEETPRKGRTVSSRSSRNGSGIVVRSDRGNCFE